MYKHNLQFRNATLSSTNTSNSRSRTVDPEQSTNERKNTNLSKTRYSSPPDHYSCDGCRCHQIPGAHGVYADCMNSAVRSIPLNLPADTRVLDLSHNVIGVLKLDALVRYTKLGRFNASHDNIYKLDKMPPCPKKIDVKIIDLSHNKIASLPGASFVCMPSLKSLTLRGNRLSNISEEIFVGLTNLQHLDLAENKLHTMQPKAFRDFRALLTLDLSYNRHLFFGWKSAQVFKPLKSLEVLRVQGCGTHGGTYPTYVLLEFPALQELSVNGEKQPFDPETAALRNLTRLFLGEYNYCWTKNFSQFYFSGLPYLKYVSVKHCASSILSPHMFDGNPYLESIDLVASSTKLDTVLESLCGLPYPRNISYLRVIESLSRSRFDPPVILRKEHVVCLRNMTRLKTLNLDSNRISLMSRGFVLGLPKSLQDLSVRNNDLVAFQSVIAVYAYLRDSFSNLISLQEDIQGTNKRYIPGVYTEKSTLVNSSKRHIKVKAGTERMAKSNIPVPLRRSDKTDSIASFSSNQRTKKQTPGIAAETRKIAFRSIGPNPDFSSPRKSTETVMHHEETSTHSKSRYLLRYYSASNAFSFGEQIMRTTTYLTPVFLNLSSTLITNWGEQPVRHVPREVRVLDLSENRCQSIAYHFFQINNSLLELHVGGNFLGPTLSKDTRGSTFSRLSRLLYLDLSRNHLFYLPRQLFQGLASLRVLKLFSNNIDRLDVQLSHMTSLVYVDATKNSLRAISRPTMADLDALARGSEVTLDLVENPLPCTCEGIQLLTWLMITRVRVLNQDFLSCVDWHNRPEDMGGLSSRVGSLRRECASHKILILSCTFGAALVLLVGVAVWVFLNRWWIIYMRNLAVSRVCGYTPSHNDDNERGGEQARERFTFDAFFVYAPSSRNFVLDDCLRELEVERGHALCVEDRDFLAGSFIPCNITSAVRSSRKTVVVLDADFKFEGWSQYAVEMAQVEAVRAKRSTLHLLTLGSLQVGRLPIAYLKAAREGRVSEAPPEDSAPDVVHEFWDALSRDIGRGRGRCGSSQPLLEVI